MKLRLVDLGTLSGDRAYFFEGVDPGSKCDLVMIGAIIEHPKAGVILYDVGPAANDNELRHPVARAAFPITSYTEDNRLDKILNKLGYELKDVRGIILSHLHWDHAGGLEFFRGLRVPLYVHAEELKYAYYALATREDLGGYHRHYMDLRFNWRAIHGNEMELFSGVKVILTPGHTPGLLALNVDLKNSAPFIVTSDTCFLKPNYYEDKPQGWLMRDRRAWWDSLRRIQNLAARSDANVILGHDPEVLADYTKEPYYD